MYLVAMKEKFQFLNDVTAEELAQNYNLYMRLSRASWLKPFFGENKIPRGLFQTIVDADVTPEILQGWYELGGLNGVYYYCNVIFGDPENNDKSGIVDVQKQTVDAL